MHPVWTIFKRELRAYFTTPLAYVFIVIFLALTGSFTFFLGGFFERGQADLSAFFVFHPWLYLFLVPAIAMRLWAEERRTGTIELLMTLPTTSPSCASCAWESCFTECLAVMWPISCPSTDASSGSDACASE